MARQSMIKKRPISGGGEEARRGDQLLEADQPAVESPTGGDYITEEIDHDMKEPPNQQMNKHACLLYTSDAAE